MKCDFYTLTYNNVIVATAYSSETPNKEEKLIYKSNSIYADYTLD